MSGVAQCRGPSSSGKSRGQGSQQVHPKELFSVPRPCCIPATLGLAHIPGLALLSGQFCELGASVPGTVPIDFLSA